MAAFYRYGFDCGYESRVKGSSQAVQNDVLERYVAIYIKPEAEKDHKANCNRCN